MLLWSRTSSLAVSAVILIAALFGAGSDADRANAPAVGTSQLTLPASGLLRHASAVRFFSGNGTPLGTSAVLAGSSSSAEAAVVAKMSAAQLAGQRVVYSYSGLTPPAGLLSLIRRGEAGGVIFFGANFSNRSQFTRAVSALMKASASKGNPARGYPLLLMTDQEGGLVRRLPGAPVLSEKKIGAKRPLSAAEAAARKAGTGAAANLLSYRLNVNLAPVLDVYRKPGDFDDRYQRSYSTRPGIVSALGADFIAAQQKGKVAATAKHFPGLGAASAAQNTDNVPVTLNLSAKTIETFDEYPYEAAIRAGVKLVMVSWARYPALDKKYPAGLSSAIVQGQLRTRLGFSGVTITDAIGAGALRAFGTTQNRALLAAKAGMDLILAAGQSTSEGTACQRGLQAAYTSGKLGAAAFKAIVTQILALRHSLPA
jgi:beta-N-acetylhexosaminidase